MATIEKLIQQGLKEGDHVSFTPTGSREPHVVRFVGIDQRVREKRSVLVEPPAPDKFHHAFNLNTGGVREVGWNGIPTTGNIQPVGEGEIAVQSINRGYQGFERAEAPTG